MQRKFRFTLLALCAVGLGAAAQQHDPAMHARHMAATAPADPRPIVHFPDDLRIHTLANMRDHLLALEEIQGALAREAYDQAGNIAEERLGMSSLKLHGAHDVAKFMPQGMQAIGTEMHRAASRLAVAAKDAGATGDVKPVLAALARVTQQCVACHVGYRVQ